ncbi:MAG TPA: hypothetical protein VFH16_07685 [Rubrobacter sp.]|nr:hypothetical protein [Rubrobacter sp.]
MKRILLLTTLVALLAAAMALSGVAQAAPTIGGSADAKCLAEAAKTVEQPGFKPADFTFIGGTEGDDQLIFDERATDGPDVFCGFGGRDVISTLDAGDIFLGGAGIDDLDFNDGGTFYGGEGNDLVNQNFGGTSFGGEGDDFVNINDATFHGGEGDDLVNTNFGTFFGGEGNDCVGVGNEPVDGPSDPSCPI